MGLRAEEFNYVADLVRKETAIVLDQTKGYLIESRLLPLAREAGLPRVEEWVRGVRERGTHQQRRAMVEALTTNETSWFRDPALFEVLGNTILPQLARDRTGPLRLWSAAASTGQEAYSLAILLEEHGLGARCEILATDVAHSVVEQAREGLYADLAVARGLSPERLTRHFSKAGPGWRIAPSLRQRVAFTTANLAGPLPVVGRMDLVLLRNVLIYFDGPTKEAVLRRVHAVLSPGSWLVLGGAESAHEARDILEPVRRDGVTLYRAR